jgi:hypothetical protein
MEHILSWVGALFLGVYLFGYEPSITEALLVFLFGVFTTASGMLVARKSNE